MIGDSKHSILAVSQQNGQCIPCISTEAIGDKERGK